MMLPRIALGVLLLGLAPAIVQAQATAFTFDSAAYVTCKQAHDMAPEPRKALAMFLAEHSARLRGVAVPTSDLGAHLGYLVRAGCTLTPDAYLYAVIDRAIVAELSKLPKRQ